MRLSLWVLIFHRVDFSHFILLLSKYWILSIINQALSKTKELPEIESRYFASEEEFPSLLASRQFIKAVILTDVCRYRFYAIPKLCIIAEFFTLHQAAKNAFDEMGVKKLPKVKDLQAEYSKPLEEKKKTYAEYRRSREEMRELLTAKANVDRVLNMDEEQKKEQEKDHGQR